MNNDPATNEFLKFLKEDDEVKGTEGRVWDGSRAAPAKKTTFKGNYGGGNEYHQMDPDLEFDNLTKRALGSEISNLDERPGSVMVNDEDEPGEPTEVELDTGDGAAVKKGRPFAAPEGFTKITDGLPVHKDAPGKTKPGKELGEDVEFGCSTCGHPQGHINFITCAEIQDFKAKHGYVPCLQDHMAGDICSRQVGHEGGHDAESYDAVSQDCQNCYGEGCDQCYDAPLSPEEPFGEPETPHNGITHESYGALPDNVIAEAIGDLDCGAMKEAPLSVTPPPSSVTPGVGGMGLSDQCLSCQSSCDTTCDICGECVCMGCEAEHNYAAHDSAAPGPGPSDIPPTDYMA